MSAGEEADLPVARRYFDAQAAYWRDVYKDRGLQGLVYHRRMETVLRWIDELNLKPGAPALDVGCGAGLLTVQLARRGMTVTATDSSPKMVSLARKHVAREQRSGAVSIEQADVNRLPFGDGEFSLVAALGLVPWLADPGRAIAEMARVLAEDGWILITADNRARLNFLVEPRENPVLTPLKLARRAHRRRRGKTETGAASYLHRPATIDRMLTAAGLTPIRRTAIGFGPFTFLGRPLLPERLGTRLHTRLEQASGRNRMLRRTGWHYVAAAQKRSG